MPLDAVRREVGADASRTLGSRAGGSGRSTPSLIVAREVDACQGRINHVVRETDGRGAERWQDFEKAHREFLENWAQPLILRASAK